VDIEPTLMRGKDGDAAVSALAAAADKGWRIAYLAVNADRPLAYSKLRATVRKLAGGESGSAPQGPVLARRTFYQGATDAQARQQVLAELKRAARGPVLYLSAEQGMKLWNVAADGAPAAAVPIQDWAALAAALPQ